MSYAIGNIVYGINLNNFPERFGEDIEFLTETGIAQRQYSGSGDAPQYLGVDLDTLDECNDVEISELTLQPTEAQIAEYKTILAKAIAEDELSDEMRERLKSTEPTVFITWGSS